MNTRKNKGVNGVKGKEGEGGKQKTGTRQER